MGAVVMRAGSALKGAGRCKGWPFSKGIQKQQKCRQFGFKQQKNHFLTTKSTLVGNTAQEAQGKCNMDTESFFLQADSTLVLVPMRNCSTLLCAFLEHIPFVPPGRNPVSKPWACSMTQTKTQIMDRTGESFLKFLSDPCYTHLDIKEASFRGFTSASHLWWGTQ